MQKSQALQHILLEQDFKVVYKMVGESTGWILTTQQLGEIPRTEDTGWCSLEEMILE